MTRRHDDGMLGGLILLAVMFVLAMVIGVAKVSTKHEVTCHVTEKDRTKDRDGKSDMRIYTDECGVLQVHDSLFAGQFDSSDVYASIKPGHVYRLTVQGWRIPLLSQFENIVDAQEVKA